MLNGSAAAEASAATALRHSPRKAAQSADWVAAAEPVMLSMRFLPDSGGTFTWIAPPAGAVFTTLAAQPDKATAAMSNTQRNSFILDSLV